MFCEHCGIKKEEEAQFCQNCGQKTGITSEDIILSSNPNIIEEKKEVFYSKEWHQKGIFAIASTPRFDVMVDDKYLYLIKLPKYNNSTLGLFLGFIFFSIIGAYIGSSIGESSDEKRRELYRLKWINLNNELISLDYKNNISFKIPLNDLRGNILFKKSDFTLKYNNAKITLGRRVRSFRTPDKTESERINKYIEKYVL